MTTPQPPVALVSGGNRGIGFEACKQLAQRGYHVILGSRDADRGALAVQALRRDHQLDVTSVVLDVSSSESVNAALVEVEHRFGRIDVLINNAALSIDMRRPLLQLTIPEVESVMQVNVMGPLYLRHAVAPGMRERGYGRIVNVSSGRGSFSKLATDGAAYRVSKAALNAVTVVLADELRGSGVLVNACTPGHVKTRMTSFRGKRTVAEGAAEILRLATLPNGSPTGGFFKDGEPIPW